MNFSIYLNRCVFVMVVCERFMSVCSASLPLFYLRKDVFEIVAFPGYLHYFCFAYVFKAISWNRCYVCIIFVWIQVHIILLLCLSWSFIAQSTLLRACGKAEKYRRNDFSSYLHKNYVPELGFEFATSASETLLIILLMLLLLTKGHRLCTDQRLRIRLDNYMT